MANPRSNLDELMKDPKSAALLKNQALLQSLLQSPDTRRLMELLRQNGGEAFQSAASRGDTKTLAGMVTQLMRSQEGARLVDSISRAVPPEKK